MERQGERIGTPWVVAMLVLLALLVIGVALYLHMAVKIKRPGGRGESARPTASISRTLFQAAQHAFPRNWV